MRVFISYCFDDETFVAQVVGLLAKQQSLEPVMYQLERRTEPWLEFVISRLKECKAFVYIAGTRAGDTQKKELQFFYERPHTDRLDPLVACLPEGTPPDETRFYGLAALYADKVDPVASLAKQITESLGGTWTQSDGVPRGYLFQYEKDIVEFYVQQGLGNKDPEFVDTYVQKVQNGLPPLWPIVQKEEALLRNEDALQDKFGNFRAESSTISVDSRTSIVDDPSQGVTAIRRTLTFPEAGPRRFHRYPLKGATHLEVAIVVSGGIAPGINAVIDGIVKRHEEYHRESGRDYILRIDGYQEGLQSLVSQSTRTPVRLTSHDIKRQAEQGGALLPTSRWDDFVGQTLAQRNKTLDHAITALEFRGVSILYVIGGDGSMRAAHALARHARQRGISLSVVAIPKTIDNDILWVWQSFGFLSAVEKARETVLHLHTEAKSNPRLCILQLFGSDSGFIAAHAGLSSGVCDAVLIPEVDYTMEGLYRHLADRLNSRFLNSPHALVVMAETALPVDAMRYVQGITNATDDEAPQVQLTAKETNALRTFFAEGRRVVGQTPDALRTAGLKIVSGVLEAMIQRRKKPIRDDHYWDRFRVFPNEPRHLIRSVPPSSADVIYAERLGALAVDNAMAGYTDCMVSQWLTEFVLVPLDLVVLGRKRVPSQGVFWKSVLLSTGQPADMK